MFVPRRPANSSGAGCADYPTEMRSRVRCVYDILRLLADCQEFFRVLWHQKGRLSHRPGLKPYAALRVISSFSSRSC